MAGMRTWLLSPGAERNQHRNIHSCFHPASVHLPRVTSSPFHQALPLYISLFPSHFILLCNQGPFEVGGGDGLEWDLQGL